MKAILIAKKQKGYLRIPRLDKEEMDLFLNNYICIRRVGNDYEIRISDKKEDYTCKRAVASWSSVVIPVSDSFMPPGTYVLIPRDGVFLLRRYEDRNA